MFTPMILLTSVILLSCGVSAWAGSSMLSDPDMRSRLSAEIVTVVEEKPGSVLASNRSFLLLSARHKFNESLRAIVDVPLLFVHVPAHEVNPGPDPVGPLPLIRPTQMDTFLGNIRLGLEFGALEDIRITTGVSLPLFNGVNNPGYREDYVVDVTQSQIAQPDRMQVDGHIHAWLLRNEKRDILLRSGIRFWVDTGRGGEGGESVLFDVEGLLRLHIGDVDVVTGPSITSRMDGSFRDMIGANLDIMLNLGANYVFAPVPIQLGLFMKIRAYDFERHPDGVMAVNLAYLLN